MARRIIAALLIIVASILAPFAVGALWAERTITESAIFVETLAPLQDDPAVQQTVATEVSTAIIDAIDAKTRVTDALSQLDGPLAQVRPDSAIAEAIASGINGAIESGVTSYTQSDRFGDGWMAISTLLQEQFVKVLNRDTTDAAVTLQEGQIILDTKVAVDKVTAELTARGVPFVDSLEVPGREVVLADTPNLQTAASALRIFLPVANWLWAVVMIMFVGGILLWRPRARGVMWTGIGLAAGGAVMLLALYLGEAEIVAQAPSEFEAVVTSVVSTMLRLLLNATLVMICVGLSLTITGWLAGATSSGRKVRDAIAGAAHRWGSPLAEGPVGRFTSDHPMFVPTLRALVIAVAAGFLILVDRRSPAMILWTFALMALALLLVEIIEGAGRGYEQPRAGALVAEAVHDPGAELADAVGTPASPDPSAGSGQA
ncbi:MAG TPA: hypothetical protein VES03_03360 [Motilibacterales bacterium]|nr:hypothetical protein [Motilibacterales bacterium]